MICETFIFNKNLWFCLPKLLSLWDIIEFQVGAKGLCNQLSPDSEGCFAGIISCIEFVSSFPEASYLKLACVELFSSWIYLSKSKSLKIIGNSFLLIGYKLNTLKTGFFKIHCIIKHLAELSLALNLSETFRFRNKFWISNVKMVENDVQIWVSLEFIVLERRLLPRTAPSLHFT